MPDKTKRNIAIWLPLEKSEIKAVVFLSHGMGEYAACHYRISSALVVKGFAVLGMDHVCHGKSDGDREQLESYETLVNDFIFFVNTMRHKDQYKHLPAFLLAHSMGVLVALKGLTQINNIDSMVLSGAPTVSGPAASSPFGLTCLYPLSQLSFAADMAAFNAAIDPRGVAAPCTLEEITSNPECHDEILRDPLRWPLFVRNKTAKELMQLNTLVKKEIPSISIPFFCIHGENDMLALVKGSQDIYLNAATPPDQKRLFICKGAKHEVFNEPPPHGQAAIQMVVEYFCDRYELWRNSHPSANEAFVASSDDIKLELSIPCMTNQ